MTNKKLRCTRNLKKKTICKANTAKRNYHRKMLIWSASHASHINSTNIAEYRWWYSVSFTFPDIHLQVEALGILLYRYCSYQHLIVLYANNLTEI